MQQYQFSRYVTPWVTIMDDYGFEALSCVIIDGDIEFPYFP